VPALARASSSPRSRVSRERASLGFSHLGRVVFSPRRTRRTRRVWKSSPFSARRSWVVVCPSVPRRKRRRFPDRFFRRRQGGVQKQKRFVHHRTRMFRTRATRRWSREPSNMMYEVGREIVALFGAPPKLLSSRRGRRAEKGDDFPTLRDLRVLCGERRVRWLKPMLRANPRLRNRALTRFRQLTRKRVSR